MKCFPCLAFPNIKINFTTREYGGPMIGTFTNIQLANNEVLSLEIDLSKVCKTNFVIFSDKKGKRLDFYVVYYYRDRKNGLVVHAALGTEFLVTRNRLWNHKTRLVKT